MDCIDLVHDKDRCRAVVNVVMNRGVAQNAGYFLTGSGPVSFSEKSLLNGVSISKESFDCRRALA